MTDRKDRIDLNDVDWFIDPASEELSFFHVETQRYIPASRLPARFVRAVRQSLTKPVRK